MPLTEELLSELTTLAAEAGQQLSVVIYNLLNGGLPSMQPALPLGYLRTEPGRGRVFGMYFEIAGFQYALLRHLAGEHLSQSRHGCCFHIAGAPRSQLRDYQRVRDLYYSSAVRSEGDDDRK